MSRRHKIDHYVKGAVVVHVDEQGRPVGGPCQRSRPEDRHLGREGDDAAAARRTLRVVRGDHELAGAIAVEIASGGARGAPEWRRALGAHGAGRRVENGERAGCVAGVRRLHERD